MPACFGLTIIFKKIKDDAEDMEHAHYHKIPCSCLNITPEIEDAEKLLQEDHIPENTKSMLQKGIEVVKEAIANSKDIKIAKENLLSEINLTKKT